MWRRGDEPALWRACHALASTAATRLGHLAAHDGEGNTSIDLAPSELGQTLFAMRLCAPDVQQEMQLSLSRLGQLTPVQAYRQGDSLELFDGLKRVRAACELSWAKLRVEGARFRGREGEAVALYRRRGLSELEEAWRRHREWAVPGPRCQGPPSMM